MKVATSSRVEKAADFVFTRSPSSDWFRHCQAVGTAIFDSESAQVVGWLHDVVADGIATLPELVELFDLTEEEGTALGLLTRDPDDTYDEYIHRLKRNDLARVVKFADLRDNIRRCSEEIATKYSLLGRYVGAWTILAHYVNKLSKKGGVDGFELN